MPASSELAVRLPDGVALHARPAGAMVRTAMRFAADITISAGDREADAKSILAVLALGAEGGTTVTLRAAGSDAEAALDAVAETLRTAR